MGFNSEQGEDRMQVEMLKHQILAAKGDICADLVLKNGKVINVFTNEFELADVAICNGKIVVVIRD